MNVEFFSFFGGMFEGDWLLIELWTIEIFFLTDPTQKLSSYIETSKNIILQPKKMLGASKLEDFKT